MNEFSTSSALRFGWGTFKKRPWFFVGATALVLVLLGVINQIEAVRYGQAFATFVVFLITMAASTLVDMGLTAFFLRAHDNVAHATVNDLWHPDSFWKYLAASICVGVFVVIGLILFIIPGIILAIMFTFVKLLVIDRKLGPVEAMKESARITKGSRLELLLFLLVLAVLNILGVLCLLVGLLVTIPVSVLALTHAYRVLSHKATHAHPNTTQLPQMPNTTAI